MAKEIVGGKFQVRNPWFSAEYVKQQIEYLFGAAICSVNKNVYIKKVRYVTEGEKRRTIVEWSDCTKTISKCHPDDKFDKHIGLMICVLKKLMSSKEYRALFNNWANTDKDVVTYEDAKKSSKTKPNLRDDSLFKSAVKLGED